MAKTKPNACRRGSQAQKGKPRERHRSKVQQLFHNAVSIIRPAAKCDGTDPPKSNSNAVKRPPSCSGANGLKKGDLTKNKKRPDKTTLKTKSRFKFKNISRNCSVMRGCPQKKLKCAPKRRRLAPNKAAKGSGRDKLCSKRKAPSCSKGFTPLSYTATMALVAARAVENYFRGPPPRRRRYSRRTLPARKAPRCVLQREKDTAVDNTISYLVSTSVTRANSPEVARCCTTRVTPVEAQSDLAKAIQRTRMPSLEKLCGAPDACCSKTNNTPRRVKTKAKAKTKRVPCLTQRCAATQVQPRILSESRTSLVSCPPLLGCPPRRVPARDGRVQTTMHVSTPTTDGRPPQESCGSSFPSPCCQLCFPDGNQSMNAKLRRLPLDREPMPASEREPMPAPEREHSGDTYCNFLTGMCSGGGSETEEWLPPPPPPPSPSTAPMSPPPSTPVDLNDGFESRRAPASKPTTRFSEPVKRRTKAKGVRMRGGTADASRKGSLAAMTSGRKRKCVPSSKRSRRPVKTPKRRVADTDIDNEDEHGRQSRRPVKMPRIRVDETELGDEYDELGRRERTACGVAVKAPILPFIGRCRMVTVDDHLPTEPSEASDQSSVTQVDDSRRCHHSRRPECGVCQREPCSCCSIS